MVNLYYFEVVRDQRAGGRFIVFGLGKPPNGLAEAVVTVAIIDQRNLAYEDAILRSPKCMIEAGGKTLAARRCCRFPS